jgi:diadenosine tetraphosphate (Ap4A) HIT family hydrolase
MPADCALCQGPARDAELLRVQVWEDDLWRLTTNVSGGYTPGFSYLEPKRHIPHITDLDGAEASTLGQVMARVTSVLKEETGCELVYVYVFGGGIPHLHLHLAPHRMGDPLNDLLIKGDMESVPLPSGAGRVISKEFPELPDEELRGVADRVRDRLAVG